MQAKNKLKAESTVFLASLAGILVLANLLSVKFFFRGDLTEDGTFTLSKASVSLVEDLKDKVVVKAYFTKNLPGRFASLERHVRDLLEEYADESNGNMKVEFIDPADDEEAEKVAKSLGIQKMPNPDIEKDQATVKEGYRGISFSFGDQTDVIPAVDSPVGLEYRITSVLKKITGQKADLGFVTGHGEPEIEAKPDPNQQMPADPQNAGAFRNIRNNLDIYNFKQIDMKKGKVGVPGGTKALVVVGSREKIEDAELYKIDQFLMSGGSVAFFVDGVNINVEQGQFPGLPPQYKTAVNETNLRDFLKHYGVELGKALVMDAQAADFPARCPPIPLTLPRPYPAWPVITAFGQDHPITHRLGSLTLPYATTVKVTDEARSDSKRKAIELAFSSGNSWVADAAVAVVDPCEIKVSNELESSIPVAAAVSGTFTSFFKGKEIPKAEAAQGEDDELNLPEAAAFVGESKVPGRLVVVGSSGLPEDETLGYLARVDRRQAMNNFTFVQNVLDWMTSEDELIAVRMKTLDDPPIEKASEAAKAAAKYGNIIGIPFAFILFGLVRWRIRRSKKG